MKKRAPTNGPSGWRPTRGPEHGQFMQLSIPKVGEAPISVSAQGDGWLEFTIRSVGRVTNVIFRKTAGTPCSCAGPYGRAGRWSSSGVSTWWSLPGGTGLAPVRSLLRQCAQQPGLCGTFT